MVQLWVACMVDREGRGGTARGGAGGRRDRWGVGQVPPGLER